MCVCVYCMWVYVYIECVCNMFMNINMYTCIWTLTHFCSLKNPSPVLLDVYFNFETCFIFKVILATDRFKFSSYRNIWSLPGFGGLWQNLTLSYIIPFSSFQLRGLIGSPMLNSESQICFSATSLTCMAFNYCFLSKLVIPCSIYVRFYVFRSLYNHFIW